MPVFPKRLTTENRYGGGMLKYRLTEKDITAIEKALNTNGASKAEVKIENNEVVVLEVKYSRVR